ncbi:MAG TPA: hypothetical protein VGG64_14745 [Pirellulales bacterium]|jgi:hypothetical protein
MAKKTSGRKRAGSPSKAQAIRDEFTSQGAGARPKDVIANLKAKGIEVSSAQVSNIKATLGTVKHGRKHNGKAGSNGTLSIEALLEAKKLADRIGGIEAARHAIEALARLS